VGAGIAAFVLTFTGFGLFGSVVIAALLARHVVRHALNREWRPTWLSAAGLAVVGAGWMRFSQNYVFLPAVDGFRFPWTPWTDYVHFVVLMLNLPTAQVGADTRHYVIGTTLALVMTVTAAGIARAWMTRQPALKVDVLVLLIGSGTLFVAATAIGRVPLGILGGTASRYLSLMIPIWLAVYLATATSWRRLPPIGAACVWMIVLLPYQSMPGRPLADWPGTIGAAPWQLDAIRHFGTNKAEWARVYLATGSVDAAQAGVQQVIHPDPRRSRLEHKLRFLRDRKLSFFAGRPDQGDFLPWLPDERFSCRPSGSSPLACR
jgi:hypothetical protein